jgi:opacity protein-like surface antigen
MKKIIAAILVLGVCTPVFAAGELQKDVSVLLGYGMPGSDMGDLIDGGVAFGLDYDGYKVNENVMIGGEFVYTGGSGSTLGIDYDVTIWGLSPYVKYQKEVDLGGKKAMAYGLFGLGEYFSSVELTNAGPFNGTTDDNSFGFNLGGGVMFPLQDKMQIGVDVRYHKMASDTSYFIPAAKFTYSF